MVWGTTPLDIAVDINLLKTLLDYDPDTGEIRWKISRSNIVKVGDVAGGISPSTGYVRLAVDKKQLAGHRVAWALHYGEWPKGVIDHINHVRTDNRIANLRDVSKQVNCINRKTAQSNKNGLPLGVFLDKRRNTFYSQIYVNGKSEYLGTFRTPEEASNAYLLARSKVIGERT